MSLKRSIKIVGRIEEQSILDQAFNSRRAEFIALYGRRRVGKTFLVRLFFESKPCFFFHATGIQDSPIEEQLIQFARQLGLTFYNGAPLSPSANWMDAFENLNKAIDQLAKGKKVVIFLDELPWMATRKSRLLQALEYYWNRYWGHNDKIKLIICGSSASWVINKVINNVGGLYNRVTRTMKLLPFSLYESQAFLKALGVSLNKRHILNLYMALGGIPQYLALIQKGRSFAQNVDHLFFQQKAPLGDEFQKLFTSLFQDAEIYIKLIRIIANYRYGISKEMLLRKSGISKGGRLTQKLNELEQTGFISIFTPYGFKERGTYYKICDEYVLFYLYWVDPYLKETSKRNALPGYWEATAQSAAWKSWAGLAFEALCDKHISQIQKALRISPGAIIGSWRYTPKNKKEESGTQIDLLFDRPDDIITICEIKYSDQPFTIDKEYAQNLTKKLEIFREKNRTKKELFLSIIASSGLKQNKYSQEIVTAEAHMDDLFNP